MFTISLTCFDRNHIYLVAKTNAQMKMVMNYMAEYIGWDVWLSKETTTFFIDQQNLERYLSIMHSVYISKV